MRKHLFILMLNAMLICRISAQTAEIIGRIVEADDRPLIGANVYLEGTILGSATDNDGVFQISGVPEGRYSLVVNLIGYREYRSKISVSGTARIDAGTIELAPTVIANEPVVVTAGKYEQKIQDIPASISTVNQQELQARNITTIDQALAYVSGVNLNGGQLSIRGSTGYSRGAGSRVLMLIDGVPLLTADTRDIVFSVVPTYLLDHVEVLKGAGSALYGSSAIGGVINVITRDIDDSPKFHLRTYGGVYSEPSHDQWKWTDDNLFTNGVSASYSRKINKIGVLAGVSRDEDDGYQHNNWSRRWSGSGKLQWEMSPFRRLTLSGNYMHQQRGNFLYWQDQQNALVPASGQEDDEVDSKRYYLTAIYRHVISPKRFWTFRGVWFRNRVGDSVSEDASEVVAIAKTLNGELQYNTQIGNIFMTMGGEGNWSSIDSDRFGEHDGVGGALYQQAEIPLSERWKATVGWRLDYFDIDSLESSNIRWNPKLGIVFQPVVGTAIRAAAGTGFRAPSMAEAFTSTIASGIRIVPNTQLNPEKSVYFELGLNRIFGTSMIADVAAFYNRFEDLIEPGFLPRGVIQFNNVFDARIAGVETALNGQFWRRKLQWGTGYSYVESRNEVIDDYLEFRPRHIFYGKLQGNFGALRLGGDYRYVSKYDRVNRSLELFISDADTRVAAHVVDLRAGAALKFSGTPLNISLQLKNALNYNYLDFVGSLAPPRRIELTLDTVF